jgi:hypothetical protein
MPKLGEPKKRCSAAGKTDNGRVGRAFKVIPTSGCYRRARRERLLSEISDGRLTHSATGWVPNPSTIRPEGRLQRQRVRSAAVRRVGGSRKALTGRTSNCDC